MTEVAAQNLSTNDDVGRTVHGLSDAIKKKMTKIHEVDRPRFPADARFRPCPCQLLDTLPDVNKTKKQKKIRKNKIDKKNV